MTTYTQSYSRLALATLNEDQHGRTCGYWYTVNDYGTAHTAFRTRAALLAWLELAGLELSADLPEHGASSYQSLLGSYRSALTLDAAVFWKVEGAHFLSLSNGSFTLGIAEVEPDTGTRTLWTLNPNVARPSFDYRDSQARIDRGEYLPPFLPELVGIERKRFSTTQGEALLTYAGLRIEQYGDDIRLCNGEWAGIDDARWINVARREAIARHLAA